MTFISILRGINVSGHKVIRMADLKALYEGIGFHNVLTFIQSGNVLFKTDLNIPVPSLVGKIESAIEEKYHFNVPVLIRNADELRLILQSNPFFADESIDREKLHVTFTNDVPGSQQLSAIQKYDFPPDQFRIIGKEVYLYCPGGYGNTKLSNSFFEKILQVKTTTRNWKTIVKLDDLASNL